MKRTRLLAFVLTLCITLAMTQFPATAATTGTYDNFEYSVENGEATVTKYNGSASTVTVPSTISGYPVTAIGSEAFYWCENVVSVTLPDNVRTIGDKAFYACSSLNSISIPYGVTAIGDSAFASCISLVTIDVPNSVKTIGSEAFRNCTSLASITLPVGLTIINYNTFAYCSELSSITFSSKVAIVDFNAFNYSSAITDVYYIGTEAQKSAIEIADGNSCLTNATWHLVGCDEGEHKKTVEVQLEKNYSGSYAFTLKDGVYNSTNKSNSSSSTFIITAKTAGEVKIQYRTSTEAGYDMFYIAHNSTNKISTSGQKTSWSTLTLNLAVGDVVTLTYTKDRSGSAGDDAVYFKIIPSETQVSANDIEPSCSQGVICDICGAEVKPATENHSYDNDCDTTCNECFSLRVINHTYDNDCDTSCNVCNDTRTVGGHIFDNACDADCNECGEAVRITEHIYDDGNDTVCNECGFEREATIAPNIPGDVNGDGSVNNKDLGMLRRFLNDWDVEIDELAADVNDDGSVNNKDLGILRRYLNDWDVELK